MPLKRQNKIAILIFLYWYMDSLLRIPPLDLTILSLFLPLNTYVNPACLYLALRSEIEEQNTNKVDQAYG